MKNISFLTLTAAIFLISAVPAYPCEPVPLIISGSTAKISDLTIHFGEGAGNPPDVWEGPIVIQAVSGKPACIVDEKVSLVEQPIYLGGDTLFVSTYSGSNGTLYAINIDDCSIVRQSKAYTGRPFFKGTLIKFPDLKSWKLDANCLP